MPQGPLVHRRGWSLGIPGLLGGKWLHLHILLSSVALEAAHGVVHVLTCVANVHTILLTARDECPDPAASQALIPTFLATPTCSLSKPEPLSVLSSPVIQALSQSRSNQQQPNPSGPS